ncbi:uncharacterized protein C10orf105-like [Conger conger]|uniref:uncharacterized protein C10orf105-like n=1 Tax=Conger conger TaxID=82655 RepID=UPI002A5A9822|nr:uncharacterized protein C10orf105-like [Conger conger]
MNSSAPYNLTETLLSNITCSPSPATPSAPPALPGPLLSIIIVLCLFLLFAGCATFMAVCRPSARGGGPQGGCGAGTPALSSEPQLRLWKRLGSVRRSFSSSFRRPPPRRAERDGPPASPLPPHLTVPCLFDHATEI